MYTRGNLVTQYADEQRNNADNYKLLGDKSGAEDDIQERVMVRIGEIKRRKKEKSHPVRHPIERIVVSRENN